VSRHVAPQTWADAFAGRLADDERAAIERHAEGCAKCARTRARVGRASDSFGAIRAQSSPELPWDAVRARVHWTVSKERRTRAASQPSAPGGLARLKAAAGARRLWLAAGLAAVGGVGIVVAVQLAASDRDASSSTGVAAATACSPSSSAAACVAPASSNNVARSLSPDSSSECTLSPEAAPCVAPSVAAGAPGAVSAEHAPIAVSLVAAPLEGLVNRAAGEVRVDGQRPEHLFDKRLVTGSVIATGEGHVDVQFGEASAFALGPRSTLELRRFDAELVELAVTGTLDVEVAPRRPGQRFLVVAGDHVVEVRGTQFRVEHDGARTRVACRHGLVAVRDHRPGAGAAEVNVGTARGVRLDGDAPVAGARVAPLTVDELDELAQATPLQLPLWDDGALAHSSSPLTITAAGAAGAAGAGGADAREVRVDAVELGRAPFAVRVMPGRHTIEVADGTGWFHRVGWVDVPAPSAGRPAPRFEVPGAPTTGRVAPQFHAGSTGAPSAGAHDAEVRSAAVAARRRELRAGLDHARLASCTRALAKAGLSGTYVQIELAIDDRGAVGFLNVLDTDLPSTTARCVRDALADVRFGAGAAATLRERIDL
jgi:hypothetical protein